LKAAGQVISQKGGGVVPGVPAVGDGSTIYYVSDPNQFSRHVIAISNTGEYRKAILTVRATSETAADELNRAFHELQAKYPNWRFII
jgi:type IV secretory pathway VirJ component